jgi:hypothetical protein
MDWRALPLALYSPAAADGGTEKTITEEEYCCAGNKTGTSVKQAYMIVS